MEKSFTSLAELRAEIDFLKVKKFNEEEAIKEKFSSPATIFHSITGLFKTDSSKKSLMQDLMHQDLLTNISRFILPLFLNGVLFKRSGFIVKTIVAFLSQKAATQVNSDLVTGLVSKFKTIFQRVGKTKRTSVVRDYGIPPDSETY